MNFSEVLQNEHFNRLASVIRVPFGSRYWRRSEHPEVPFWNLVERFDAVTSPDIQKLNRKQAIEAFTKLVTSIVEADPRLSYESEDIEWFVAVLDRPDSEALAILNMLKAWYSADETVLTTAKVAEKTGMAESTWRNKASRADGGTGIPGVRKLGKTWLIPRSVLKYQLGYDV